MAKRREIIEALKSQCQYFFEDESSQERIGSISFQDKVFDVKLINEYHYRYLVLSYELENGDNSSLSEDEVDEINERFICGKCFLTKKGVRLIIGFPIIETEWLGEQVEASLRTLCVMVNGVNR